ncbi:hypothetical protein BH11PLA2_BH11PLA2_25460 [soil metagenome]
MTAPPLHDPAERLAAAELGLEPTATRADVRAAFLTRLAQENFVPAPKTLAAVCVLGGESLSLPMSAQNARDEFEAADLEQYLKDFWSLLPEERFERWQWLKETENSPQVQCELERIAPAVPMQATHFESESENEIAVLFRNLFLMPVRARAIKRTEWLFEHSRNENYRTAARKLESFAVLDPPFFDALENPTLKQFEIKGISDADRQRYTVSDNGETGMEYVICLVQRLDSRLRYLMEVKYPYSLRVIGCIIGVAMFFVFSDRKPKTYPQPPMMQSPSHNDSLEQVAKDTKKFLDSLTPEQIRQLETYDPKSGRPQPDGYVLWRLAGGTPKPRPSEHKP